MNTPTVSEILESRSAEYLTRCLETQPHDQRHAAWAKLYAASRRLSEAARENKAGEALIEICSNLLGCEELALIQIERDSNTVSVIHETGVTPVLRAALAAHAENIAAEISQGRVRIPGEHGWDATGVGLTGLSALVPLWENRETQGAIVFFNLLPQRQGFDSDDRELLQLLSVYAGPSLFPRGR
jgi:hypothetical protein